MADTQLGRGWVPRVALRDLEMPLETVSRGEGAAALRASGPPGLGAHLPLGKAVLALQVAHMAILIAVALIAAFAPVGTLHKCSHTRDQVGMLLRHKYMDRFGCWISLKDQR